MKPTCSTHSLVTTILSATQQNVAEPSIRQRPFNTDLPNNRFWKLHEKYHFMLDHKLSRMCLEGLDDWYSRDEVEQMMLAIEKELRPLIELKIDVSELSQNEVDILNENIELVEIGIDVLELTPAEIQTLKDNIDLVRRRIDVLECNRDELESFRNESEPSSPVTARLR